MKLKNKVALVTGSSRGLGKAIALRFANEGANVIINYISSRDEADSLVKQLNSQYPSSKFAAIKCDVSDESQIKKMFEEIDKKFGRLDILVNNAGIMIRTSTYAVTVDDFERIMNVNLIGTFLCSREAVKLMQKTGKGKIINLSSIRGLEHCGRVGQYAYNCSKAAVINLTKTMAKEFAPNININAIAPGIIDTDMLKSADQVFKDTEIKKIYVEKFGEPEDIAGSALFLSSDDSNYVYGQVIVVDGGYSLK